MRRLCVVGMAVLVLALGPWVVSSAARADSLHTFAVGGGVVVCDPTTDFLCDYTKTYEHFAFSAHLDLGNPTQPSGHVVLREGSGPGMSNGQISFQGPVTCLSTEATPDGKGGMATITFQVTKTNAASAAQYMTLYMTFAVMDSGQGSSMPDQITVAYEAPEGAQDCRDDQQYILLQPATQGNIAVSLQTPLMGAALQGNWWYTDSSGNLYVWDPATNSWMLVQ